MIKNIQDRRINLVGRGDSAQFLNGIIMKKIIVMMLLISTSSVLSVGSYSFMGSLSANPIARGWQKQREAEVAADDRAGLEALCNDPRITVEQLNTPQIIAGRKIKELPLIMATWRVEWRDILIRLLQMGANPNIEHYGSFPLKSAAGSGNIPGMRCLLEYGAQTDFRNSSGQTALMSAVHGHLEAVRILLYHSTNPADPSIEDRTIGNALVHHLIGLGAIPSYRDDSMEIVQELVKHGVRLNMKSKLGSELSEKYPDIVKLVQSK